jgi:cytochrome c oxidase cbb3-type subunit III
MSLGIWSLPLLPVAACLLVAQTVQTPSVSRSAQQPAKQPVSPALIATGQALFLQDCAFCHGKDAGGGETGPDLTRSRLVRADVSGDKIGEVVRNGRPDKGMPPFNLTVPEISALSAFIHDQWR